MAAIYGLRAAGFVRRAQRHHDQFFGWLAFEIGRCAATDVHGRFMPAVAQPASTMMKAAQRKRSAGRRPFGKSSCLKLMLFVRLYLLWTAHCAIRLAAGPDANGNENTVRHLSPYAVHRTGGMSGPHAIAPRVLLSGRSFLFGLRRGPHTGPVHLVRLDGRIARQVIRVCRVHGAGLRSGPRTISSKLSAHLLIVTLSSFASFVWAVLPTGSGNFRLWNGGLGPFALQRSEDGAGWDAARSDGREEMV